MHIEANQHPDSMGPPPKGFHVTQLTQDGSGAVKSVQSKPDVEDPVAAPRLAPIMDDHEVTGLSFIIHLRSKSVSTITIISSSFKSAHI
jgi:hypothetical protein